MRKMCKKKVVHRTKRKMYRLFRRIERFWGEKKAGISFAMMGVGFVIMLGVEESVKREVMSMQQGFWYLVIATVIAYIGAKMLEGVEIQWV